MISIIVPLYNKEATIKNTIDSIVTQSYTDWELLIIDDGSTDGSAKVVKPYTCDERIQYIYKKNGGVSSARNLGIQLAKGEWLTYIDADDFFLSNALEILFDLVQRYKTLCSSANFYIEKKNQRHKVCYGRKEGILKNNFKACFFMNCFPRAGATLVHFSILRKHLFNECLSRYEDAQSLFDIMRECQIAYSPHCVMIYSCDFSNLSHKAKDITLDFISCMHFSGKSFWEKMVLANLLNEGLRTYIDKRTFLRNKYKDVLYLLVFFRILGLVKRVKIIILNFFCK